MGRTAESIRSAAAELHRQDCLPLDSDDEPEMAQRWERALAALGEVPGLFEEIANGWI
jgi:hypothetical protein